MVNIDGQATGRIKFICVCECVRMDCMDVVWRGCNDEAGSVYRMVHDLWFHQIGSDQKHFMNRPNGRQRQEARGCVK